MILQTFLTVKRILITAKNSFQTSKRNQQRKNRAKGLVIAMKSGQSYLSQVALPLLRLYETQIAYLSSYV